MSTTEKWTYGISYILKTIDADDITDELSIMLYTRTKLMIRLLKRKNIQSISELQDFLASQDSKILEWYLKCIDNYNEGVCHSVLGLWDKLQVFENYVLKQHINVILEEFVSLILDQTHLQAQKNQRNILSLEDFVDMILANKFTKRLLEVLTGFEIE